MEIEKLLAKLAASQALEPEDRLSAIVARYAPDELDEGSLNQVFAAARQPDYQEFLDRAAEQKKKP